MSGSGGALTPLPCSCRVRLPLGCAFFVSVAGEARFFNDAFGRSPMTILDQNAFEDFAGGVARKRVQKHHIPRNGETCEPLMDI